MSFTRLNEGKAHWHKDTVINLVVSQKGMCSTKLIRLGETLARIATHLGHGVLHFVVPACESLTHHPGHCKTIPMLGKVDLCQEIRDMNIRLSCDNYDKEEGLWRICHMSRGSIV